MNTLNLQGQRDFAFSTDVLAFMQDAYSIFEKLTALGGSNFILSGCVVNGSSVSAGWIVLAGKLVYLSGGTVDANTKVKLVTTPETIALGTLSREQTTFTAEFSQSSGTVLWSTLDTNRMDTIQNITNRLTVIEYRDIFLEIGEWNMTADSEISIAHSLDFTKISFPVNASIRNDNNDGLYDLTISNANSGVASGRLIVTADSIILQRYDGELFSNNPSFDSAGGYNRGWITIKYDA